MQDLLTLFFTCLLSGVLLPFPEDVALLVAGWKVKLGESPLWVALAAGLFGTFGRDAAVFFLGRYGGSRVMPYVRRWFGPARIDRAHATLVGKGRWSIFGIRFLVGARAPLYFMAGALEFPVRAFLVADALGLLVTTPLTLWIGWRFGPTTATWLQEAIKHQRVLLIVAALGLAAFIWRRSKRPAIDREA